MTNVDSNVSTSCTPGARDEASDKKVSEKKEKVPQENDKGESDANKTVDLPQQASIEDYDIYRLGPMASGGEELRPGDHIYQWCTGYQHHGIVLDINNGPLSMQVAEFTNMALETAAGSGFVSVSAGAVSTSGVTGGLRIITESQPDRWHKVKYQASALECLSWRPGTCAAATPSDSKMILNRVRFLLQCRHLIPNYSVFACNCETVAGWCVTGKWETSQGNFVHTAAQIGSVVAMAAVPGAAIGGAILGGTAKWHSMDNHSRRAETAAKLEKELEWWLLGKKDSEF